MKLALNCAVALAFTFAAGSLPGCSSQPGQPDHASSAGQSPAKQESAPPAPAADAKAAGGPAKSPAASNKKGTAGSPPTADASKTGATKPAEPPVDLAKVVPGLITGFQSSYSAKVFAAAEQFRQLPPEAQRNALAQLSANESASVRHNAWRAFSSWATREDVPTLKAALESPHEEVRIAALELLARFPNDETIDVLTQKMQDPALRERAESLLVRVGPAAEGAVLDYASHSDAGLRAAAWRVLGRIGTRKSLLSLEQLATQPQFQQAAELKDVLKEIRARLRKS